MADTFRIIGDEIHFGPFVVARFATAVPSTVRDHVEELLDGTSRSSYDRGYEDGRRETMADLNDND